MTDYDFDAEASKLFQLRNKVLLQYATSSDPILRAKYDRLLLEKKLRKDLAENAKYEEYKSMGRVDLVPYTETQLNLEEKNVKKLHDAMKINYKVEAVKPVPPPPQPLQPPPSYGLQTSSAYDQQLRGMFLQMQQQIASSPNSQASLQEIQKQFQSGTQMSFPGFNPHQAQFYQAQFPPAQFPPAQFPQTQFSQAHFPQAHFPQAHFPQSPHPQGKRKKAKLDY